MRLRNKQGSLLVMTLLLMVVLLTLGAAYMAVSVNASRVAERQRRTALAFQIAEAGIHQALYDLREDFIGDLSSPSWTDTKIHDYDLDFATATPDADGFFDFPYASTTLNGGTYEVRVTPAGSQGMWVRSTGRMGDASQTIQVYAKISQVSPWDNAIFAGEGADSAGGKTIISGCVNIRGSVHILGSGLESTDLAVELGGTAELIGNSYDVMPSSLRARVPALETTVVNGETVETLHAVLRVKRGIVSLDGASSVGLPDNPGNNFKEMVDAVYSTDGFAGNSGVANVHSDNGWSNAYDLGDTVTFPSLNDPYEGYATYKAYLHDHALVISDPADLAKLASVTSGSSFTLSDANGSISMDGAGHLSIDGIVYIDGGDLNITGKNDVIYTGRGSIYVTGNVAVDTNLVTPAGQVNFPYNPSTGQENIIGIMTPGNILLGTSAQLDIMGLFYAGETVTTNKQTDIVGTLVANSFDMTGQVPNIFQVPATVNYLPPGMIGSTSGWQMTVVSWQVL